MRGGGAALGASTLKRYSTVCSRMRASMASNMRKDSF